jgi:hypothetical protein
MPSSRTRTDTRQLPCPDERQSIRTDQRKFPCTDKREFFCTDLPEAIRTDRRQAGSCADISAPLPISAQVSAPPPVTELFWRRQRNSLIVARLRH